MSTENETITAAARVHGYMPAAEAATRCGCAVSTIYRKIERGAVEGFKAGASGLWFVRRVSLVAHYGPEVSKLLGIGHPMAGENLKAKPLTGDVPKAKPAAKRKAPARAR